MTIACFWIRFSRRWGGLGLGGLVTSLLSLAAPIATPAAMASSIDLLPQNCPVLTALTEQKREKPPCDRPETLGLALPVTTHRGVWTAAATPPRAHRVPPSAGAAAPATPPQLAETPEDSAAPGSSVQRVDVNPAIIEGSPVLQRWLEEVPDLAVDIAHDPAFRTRVRVGYAEFPSTDNTGGVYVGVQDVFVGRTPLTLSAEYAANSRGDRHLVGADAQYYLLPLGWYGNIAPVVGYRDIRTSEFASEGLNLGLRVILIPSRTGTADLSITQSWVAPGSDQEVGMTSFAAGYAIAEDLRLGTDIQILNSRERQESRVGILLEWML